MTDIRQALEEAFGLIHPEPFTPAVFKRARHPDDATHALDGLFPDWDKWNSTRLRFRRFLDAEAWTDAALMLPSQRAKSSALRKAGAEVSEKLALHIRFIRDDVDYSAEIALALAALQVKP